MVHITLLMVRLFPPRSAAVRVYRKKVSIQKFLAVEFTTRMLYYYR